jgi:Putative DNA-binding domain
MRAADFNVAIGNAKFVSHPRFYIYRNNVRAGLVNALRVRFPVIEKLVGADYFNFLASEYVGNIKPNSAVLIGYGASFADFIAGKNDLVDFPYLADVARFENCWWKSYHAENSANFDVSVLAKLPPEEWAKLKFKLQSDVVLFHSPFAAASIWQWHQIKNNSEMLSADGEQFAVVQRIEQHVVFRFVSSEFYFFVNSLLETINFSCAVEATVKVFPEFNLQANLQDFFQFRLLAGVNT